MDEDKGQHGGGGGLAGCVGRCGCGGDVESVVGKGFGASVVWLEGGGRVAGRWSEEHCGLTLFNIGISAITPGYNGPIKSIE